MRIKTYTFAALAAGASAQWTGWAEDQVNTSICIWTLPRAALVRDTVYLDGGEIWWSRGLADGRYDPASDTGNFQGQILTYNLSDSFEAKDNTTGILLKNTISKARGGSGNANRAPNTVDGGMLANDYQFYMYGGAVLVIPEQYDAPEEDDILGYQVYQYGPDKPAWQRGFDEPKLNNNVTRYVAYGAAVSAPSENKAWYFSGLTTENHTDIWVNPNIDEAELARETSDRLIEVDMKVQTSLEWSNSSLSGGVKGRSNAEAVWVPVGEQGILVVLGGATQPYWASLTQKSDDEEASKDESPKFMETIDIYDVAGGDWYKQTTENGPGTRARGCAVVAVAQDSSSYNIYYYGGNDGLHPREPFYDDVWVLSLPSFTWTQLNKGEDIHSRAGHKCFKPYDDQMMIIGGETAKAGTSISCLKDGPIVMFNLTSGEWMDSYHPDEYGAYGVPEKVRDTIGGDATGGATITTPEPSGWDDDGLQSIFSKTYDMSKISTWGPYAAESEQTGRPELPNDGEDDGGGGGSGGLPSWVAPVLGVVLGLMAITGLLVGWCLLRRRGMFTSPSSDYGTEDPGNRIMSWIKGQPTDKAPTATTSDYTHLSPDVMDVKAVPAASHPMHSPPPTTVEAAGTPIAELDDTSPPAELSGTGLSHSEVITKHSRVAGAGTASQQRTLSQSSFNTTNFSGASSLSRSSAGDLESPAIPVSPEPGQQASFGQHQHMRSMSEAMEGYESRPSPGERRVSDQLSPISPPTAGDAPGDDYIGARTAMVSPLRKSVFRENEDDLGKDK
ncbi:uncharacterized protein F5Z01DRAFT_27835 [Emericellopsis atlantica]|uniref:Kelch repeat protein n=1 Tax=Emericellopsis atlantica TaxID=2614577 RepID=A0A9P7ZVM2_9HYPO|nr:uncharacterized protein F5Z01DRAFT_27835 [Emericellopsis atlantica]KAG9259164.1 hypothetical protein F5Z01DRAFT_27835 [Emericellopsis atlantica]